MENINELITALAKARADFSAIEKNETANMGTYSYSYASLSEILDKTTGSLSKNGLALLEIISETESGTLLTVVLAHSSGQTVQSEKLLGTYKDPKQFGGAMTYFRRYLVEGLLNIASQQDKDAQGVESETEPRKIKTYPPKQDPVPANKPYKFPCKAAENFYTEVQAQTGNYYKNAYQLLEVIGGWFNYADGDAWDAKMSIAVDHAHTEKPAEQEPLFPSEPAPVDAADM